MSQEPLRSVHTTEFLTQFFLHNSMWNPQNPFFALPILDTSWIECIEALVSFPKIILLLRVWDCNFSSSFQGELISPFVEFFQASHLLILFQRAVQFLTKWILRFICTLPHWVIGAAREAASYGFFFFCPLVCYLSYWMFIEHLVPHFHEPLTGDMVLFKRQERKTRELRQQVGEGNPELLRKRQLSTLSSSADVGPCWGPTWVLVQVSGQAVHDVWAQGSWEGQLWFEFQLTWHCCENSWVC